MHCSTDHLRKLSGLSAVALVAGSLALAACGGGAGGEDLADVDTTPDFSVVATEMSFTPSRVAVEAGNVSVILHNEGTVLHDLHIEDQPFLVEAGAGETGEGTVTLEPGQYAFWCALPGHRAAGMEGVLEVR